MIDEPRLVRALTEVVGHLARLGCAVVPLIRPGLTAAEIAREEAKLPFALTEEIRAVYRWCNGVRALDGKVLADVWFFPGFYLPRLEDAVREFEDRKLGPQWRKGWFPLFSDGAGDFYNVACRKQTADAAPVIGFMHGEPDQNVEYLSVTTMIETLADCYRQGAFFLDPDGALDMDDEAHRKIALQHNPGVSVWQS
jgi:cell wall assembly regulator SMI1